MKKASSRSQRGGSKGIKGKHVLQICVLLGVCIWLIYQVKYSHDKKKEFYEKDGEKSSVLGKEDGLVKLGRKDLLPGYHSNKKENEKPVEEDEEEEEEVSHGGEKESKSKVENVNHEEEEKEEEEEVVEEDEEEKNKQGEEVVEEDEDENKHEEDEIDEQDQSKSGGDGDKDDELLEEEQKRGSNDEKEKENDRVDEIDMTIHEARDEHYKADDASSAVSHESRILKTENLKESFENSTETGRENDSNEVKIEKKPVLKSGEVESGGSVEKTTTEVKDGDGESSNAETKSAVTELTGEKVNGHSTEAILEASRVLQNETEIMRERSQEHNKKEDDSPPAGISNLQTVVEIEQARNESNPSITVSANITNIDSTLDESRNSTSESSLIENISSSNTTEVKENLESEGGDVSGEKDTEQTEGAEDTTETSIFQEEREALIDPQTLPDIRLEGSEEDEEEALAAE